MKRRDFLKRVGATPFVGLAAETKTEPSRIVKSIPLKDDKGGFMGVALEDIPKDGYGWVQIILE